MLEPLVSVIIPCYNQGKYIQDAVNSVLNSTYKNFEIIIVNDGSNDNDTKEILNNLNNEKIKIIHQENQGVITARNNAIKASTGEYILPLDADDKIHETYIEKAINIFRENPNIGLVSSYIKTFGDIEKEIIPEKFSIPSFLINNTWSNSTFYKKSDWQRVGGYKTEMALGWEDYEFWISLIEIGMQPYFIPEFLYFYRKTKEQYSRTDYTDRTSDSFYILTKKLIKLHPDLYIDNLEMTIFPILFRFIKYIPEKRKMWGCKKIITDVLFSKNTLLYCAKKIKLIK